MRRCVLLGLQLWHSWASVPNTPALFRRGVAAIRVCRKCGKRQIWRRFNCRCWQDT
jgi:hypothetical protein